MPHYCYILYSAQLDKYYIGETTDLSNRIEMHNIGFSSFTSKVNDWKLYLAIKCTDRPLALKIEAHIKRMKSRKYIENLKRFPEILNKR
jgi:putative endonuclease